MSQKQPPAAPDLKQQIAQAIDKYSDHPKRTEAMTDAVMAVLREQEPAGLFTRSDDGGLVQAHDGVPLYAAPVPPSAPPDQAAIEAIAHRTCTTYRNGERPEYTFLPHTLMDFVRRLALPAPAESAVPELLEALQALETLFSPLASDSTAATWIDKARAAIAKAAMLAAAPKPECHHQHAILQQTGDGTPVEFCPDCGRNEIVGSAPKPEGE